MTAETTTGYIPVWTLGDRLRKARQHTGLTTRDFAEEIGVSQKTITDAENDRVKPRRITLLAYSARTGVPVGWIETGVSPARGEVTPPYPPTLRLVTGSRTTPLSVTNPSQQRPRLKLTSSQALTSGANVGRAS